VQLTLVVSFTDRTPEIKRGLLVVGVVADVDGILREELHSFSTWIYETRKDGVWVVLIACLTFRSSDEIYGSEKQAQVKVPCAKHHVLPKWTFRPAIREKANSSGELKYVRGTGLERQTTLRVIEECWSKLSAALGAASSYGRLV
jgi:hypothetical protein